MSDGTYPTPEHGWTCFHCGEHFPGNMEGAYRARIHFGATINTLPGCLEKLTAPERSLLRQLRAAQHDNERLRAEAEDEFGQRYYARVSADIKATAAVFKDCSSLRDLFNLYDSMEGRALAAEERLAEISGTYIATHGTGINLCSECHTEAPFHLEACSKAVSNPVGNL